MFRWHDRRKIRRKLDEGTRFVAQGYPVKFATETQSDTGKYAPSYQEGIFGFCNHLERFIWLLPNGLERSYNHFRNGGRTKDNPRGYQPGKDPGPPSIRDQYKFTRYVLTHERMHERVSTAFDSHNEIEHFLANVLEDERIERAASRRWNRALRFVHQGNALQMKYFPGLRETDDVLDILDYIKMLPHQLRTGLPM